MDALIESQPVAKHCVGTAIKNRRFEPNVADGQHLVVELGLALVGLAVVAAGGHSRMVIGQSVQNDPVKTAPGAILKEVRGNVILLFPR